MRRLLSVVVIFLIAGVALACGGDEGGGQVVEGRADIEAVVKEFYDAGVDHDLGRMENALSPSMDSSTRGKILRAFNAWRNVSSAELDAIRVVQLSTIVSGDRAEVDVIFKAGNADTVTVLHEGDTWRIISVVTHD